MDTALGSFGTDSEEPPLRILGFKTKTPENWNHLWVLWWVVGSPALIVAAFHVSFAVWVVLAVVGFLVPELISLQRKDDALPPLTHTIRHYLPNWAAFPLINFALGSVGAHWLGLSSRQWGVGALMALLGWLTDHFIGTYARPDPHPFGNPDSEAPPTLQERARARKMPA